MWEEKMACIAREYNLMCPRTSWHGVLLSSIWIPHACDRHPSVSHENLIVFWFALLPYPTHTMVEVVGKRHNLWILFIFSVLLFFLFIKFLNSCGIWCLLGMKAPSLPSWEIGQPASFWKTWFILHTRKETLEKEVLTSVVWYGLNL